MTQILITLDSVDCSDVETATVRQLIDLELKQCPRCNQIHSERNLLPFHCQSCFTLRDERWMRHLLNRTRSLLSNGAFGLSHD